MSCKPSSVAVPPAVVDTVTFCPDVAFLTVKYVLTSFEPYAGIVTLWLTASSRLLPVIETVAVIASGFGFEIVAFT